MWRLLEIPGLLQATVTFLRTIYESGLPDLYQSQWRKANIVLIAAGMTRSTEDWSLAESTETRYLKSEDVGAARGITVAMHKSLRSGLRSRPCGDKSTRQPALNGAHLGVQPGAYKRMWGFANQSQDNWESGLLTSSRWSPIFPFKGSSSQ